MGKIYKIYLFFILICISNYSFSINQNSKYISEIDSLIQELSLKTDTSKVKIFKEIYLYYYHQEDYINSIKYAEQALFFIKTIQ